MMWYEVVLVFGGMIIGCLATRAQAEYFKSSAIHWYKKWKEEHDESEEHEDCGQEWS